MNQTKNKGTPRAVRRGGRNPASCKRSVPIGKWKARVKVTSKGPNRADRQRKVDNTRTVQVPLDDVLGDLIARLRSGEDVAKMPIVADFIARNHDALEAGLVIGNYKFTLITREELTAIRIDEPKEGN